MLMDRRIRFEYATCGRGIHKEKVADSKISRYVWTGPERVVQYSDKFMHGIVLYYIHITIE